MRFVERTGPGRITVNYMWLPSWIGLNTALLQELDAQLTEHCVGKQMSEELLDQADELLQAFLVEKFKSISGLADYLDGIKYVENHGDEAQIQAG